MKTRKATACARHRRPPLPANNTTPPPVALLLAGSRKPVRFRYRRGVPEDVFRKMLRVETEETE